MTDALRPSELFALRWQSFDNANTLSLTETVYRRALRSYGKTPKSLGKMHLPDGLAAELKLWNLECPDPSPEAFIFPNADGGLIDTANYRSRILKPLADELGIPKLNFQVLRRTMATRAQNLGSVKDIQSHLRHSRADTTANEYMQELPESVQQMVGTVFNLADARRKLYLWRRDYNHRRPHSALDDRTPVEFATTYRRGKDCDRTALEDALRLPLFHRATAAAIIEQNNSHSNLLLEALT